MKTSGRFPFISETSYVRALARQPVPLILTTRISCFPFALSLCGKILLAPCLVEPRAPICGKHHIGAVRVALVYFYDVLFEYVFPRRA